METSANVNDVPTGELVECDTWRDQLIVLSETAPVIIKYQVMPTDSDSEVIGAFSLNRRSWEQGGCDAFEP